MLQGRRFLSAYTLASFSHPAPWHRIATVQSLVLEQQNGLLAVDYLHELDWKCFSLVSIRILPLGSYASSRVTDRPEVVTGPAS